MSNFTSGNQDKSDGTCLQHGMAIESTRSSAGRFC